MIEPYAWQYWSGFTLGAALTALAALGIWVLVDLWKRRHGSATDEPEPEPWSPPWMRGHTDVRCCEHVCLCGYAKSVVEQAEWSTADV